MYWYRVSANIFLACLCYVQGVVTALVARHKLEEKLIIFMVGCFSLGSNSLASIFLQSSVALFCLNCFFGALYLASSVVFVTYILNVSDHQSSSKGWSFFHYENSVFVLSLALASMAVVGFIMFANFSSHIDTSSPAKDPECEEASWELDSSSVEELSLNKSHRVSFQPPIVHLELDGSLSSEKTLHNKDSEKTLVVPIMSREDDLSLMWLIQASMSNSAMYESSAENWMNTKKMETSRLHPNETLRSDSDNLISKPKVRLSRSNTTGSILYSSPNKKNPQGILTFNDSAKIMPRSISLGELQFKSRAAKRNGPHHLHERQSPVSLQDTFSKDFDGQQSRLFNSYGRDRVNKKDKVSSFWHSVEPASQNIFQEGTSASENDRLSADGFSITHNYEDADIGGNIVHGMQKVLSPALESSVDNKSDSSSIVSIPDEQLLDGLENIAMGAPQWRDNPSSSKNIMNTVSLNDWEANQEQWSQHNHANGPILFGYDSHYKSTSLPSITSAPSLHTYRESCARSSRVSSHTLSTLDVTLHKCVTPPQHQIDPHDAPREFETSPLRKMMGLIKKRDLEKSPKAKQKHKHSSSLANSMKSVASGISSRSGSPRKVKTSFLSRPSLESQSQRLPFTIPPAMSLGRGLQEEENLGSSLKPHIFKANDKFWDSETEDSDRSRVSSVPSVIIGKYDREKWRTMRELQKITSP